MKNKILSIATFVAPIVTLTLAVAQEDNLKIDPLEATQPQKQKLVRVCTLKSIQANQDFQRNVGILQAQRQRAIELSNAIDTNQSETDKQALQEELNLVMAKLNENNKTMVQTYGFSLTHNYTLMVEKAHIYMLVSEEEAARIEAVQKEKEQQKRPSD